MNSAKAVAEARELHELKQQALQYYEENGVPAKIQDIMNAMFYDNPDDVYGHLANYFDGFSKVPVISKIEAREVVDCKGQPVIQTEIFCTVRNHEKSITTSTGSNVYSVPDNKPEEKDQEDEERRRFVEAGVELIEGKINEELEGFNPWKQEEADMLLVNLIEKLKAEEEERLAKEKEESGDEGKPISPTETQSQTKRTRTPKSPKGKGKGPAVVVIPDEPLEKFHSGCNAVSVLSQALCQSAAALKDIPLYQHVAELTSDQNVSEYRIPLPMVTILSSGKALPGKLYGVKEFMIAPKPGMPIKQSIKHIMNIYNHVAKAVTAKAGIKDKATARNTNDFGCLCPQLEKIEQGLDLIQEAITASGLTPAEDFHIFLNSAGREMFDYDKGKYEVVAGQQKLSDDLAEYWAEILGRYPAVIGIVDPMRKQEKESWMKLCDRITEKCYVIGDDVYHRPGLLRHEELDNSFRTSGIVLKLENMTTVTDIHTAAKKMQEADSHITLSSSVGDSSDSFLADLAVGINAKFLKVGAPCRGERVSKLNRLVQIEAELEREGKLGVWGDHTFTQIRPPTPPPPEEERQASPAK